LLICTNLVVETFHIVWFQQMSFSLIEPNVFCSPISSQKGLLSTPDADGHKPMDVAMHEKG